jgi:transposase
VVGEYVVGRQRLGQAGVDGARRQGELGRVHRLRQTPAPRRRHAGLPGGGRTSCHRCRATKEFVAATEVRLKLFYLPGYSPELNRDEWVWKNVKHDRIAKVGVTSKDNLKIKPPTPFVGCRKCRAWCGFFHDPNLAHITA